MPRRRNWRNSSSRSPGTSNKTNALKAQAAEFLKEHHILEPGEFRIIRIVGVQRARAREHIFRRLAEEVPRRLTVTLDDLLVVAPDENVSGLQTIKANPSKPSVDAILKLVGKLKVIEATGVLAVDLSWLNGNYQRALFHQVRKSSAARLREADRVKPQNTELYLPNEGLPELTEVPQSRAALRPQ